MTDQELDRLIRRALVDSMRRQEETAADDGPAFQPSARYRRQTRAMLADPAGWARRRQRPLWLRAARQAAMLLLTCALAFGCVMAVSPTARAAVTNWAVEWYEAHIIYRFSGEQSGETLPRYEIRDLPEGYEEVEGERVEWPNMTTIIYRNAAGEEICLTYSYMQQGSAADFTTDDTVAVPVKVNGLPGQLFLSTVADAYNTIIWIDPDANIHFSIDAFLGEDDMLHIAESVILCKTEN